MALVLRGAILALLAVSGVETTLTKEARPEVFGREIERLRALANNPSELRNRFHEFALSTKKDYVIGTDTNDDGEIGVEEVVASPEKAEEYELRSSVCCSGPQSRGQI
jgi:hypothetical protein